MNCTSNVCTSISKLSIRHSNRRLQVQALVDVCDKLTDISVSMEKLSFTSQKRASTGNDTGNTMATIPVERYKILMRPRLTQHKQSGRLCRCISRDNILSNYINKRLKANVTYLNRNWRRLIANKKHIHISFHLNRINLSELESWRPSRFLPLAT